MHPLIPVDESERLEALYSYNILDSAPGKKYNELVELATQICGCPIAAITFIDKDRQWFKAKVGDKTPETPRDISFCAHTILSDEPLIIEDVAKDERFASNPDVTGGLGIRFYAGVPIYSHNKKRLGSICVIDREPRTVTSAEVAALKLISMQITSLLELGLRKKLLQLYSKRALLNSETFSEAFLNESVVPKWIYELDTLNFLQVNEAALNKYEYTKEEFLQMSVYDICPKEEKLNIFQLVQTVKRGDQLTSFKSVHYAKGGRSIYVEVSIMDTIYMGRAARVATIIDVTERESLRKALQDEKEQVETKIIAATFFATEKAQDVIGKELHDNINQILSSIRLFLDLADKQEEMRTDMIRRSKVNIDLVINEIRKLSKTLVTVDEDEFMFSESVQDLTRSYSLTNTFDVHLTQSDGVDSLPYDVKLNLFRIIQEQLNNISKYAEATDVWIRIKSKGELQLIIEDNGKGFDPQQKRAGIGLNNIRKRAEFYRGTCQITSSPGKGTALFVEIPVVCLQ